MKTNKLSKIVKNTKVTLSKHSPEILTGIGIAGMCGTVVLAVKATPKALKLMEDAEYEKGESLTVPEKAKACWKCYIPTAVSGVTSMACIIGANSVNARRNAALATAYKLSETAFTEYKQQVVETIGEKKEKIVKEKIAKKKIQKNPVSNNQVIVTEKGNTLCYDSISGRYFRSDIETIKKAVNELNSRMVGGEMYISLTEYYLEIGLQPTKVSDELGWNLNHEGIIELDFSSHIADDGTPCVVVDYLVAPRYDYSSFA